LQAFQALISFIWDADEFEPIEMNGDETKEFWLSISDGRRVVWPFTFRTIQELAQPPFVVKAKEGQDLISHKKTVFVKNTSPNPETLYLRWEDRQNKKVLIFSNKKFEKKPEQEGSEEEPLPPSRPRWWTW